MTVLIIGSNGSGKSVYAEKLAASLSKQLVYIATMKPYGEEGEKRVAKHKAQRAKYGFLTIESPYCLSGISVPESATVLLEDVSNLLGNAVFEKKQPPMSVYDDILALEKRCKNLILVSIGGLSANDGGDEGTKGYIRALEDINRALSRRADRTIVMREGEPFDEAYT